jgi:hypothetical protein
VKRLRWGLIVVLAAAIAALMASGVGSVFAARKGDDVTCKVVGKREVSCPKKELKGKKGKRGKRGPAGPPGPPGPAGSSGAGSNLNLNFNAYLTPNKTKEITVNNFTITAASDGFGKCVPISLRVGGADSRLSVGSGGAFAIVLNNENRALTDGANSNMFTAVTENGASTISGIVGSTTAGGVCLVSGYVTGN